MIDAIIAFSLRQRVLIGLLTLALAAAGVWAFTRLPIDAVPDVTNNQVQVLTGAPALSSLEVERIVLVGAATEGCVVQTAIDAREHALRATIVPAACATTDPELEATSLRYAADVGGVRLA